MSEGSRIHVFYNFLILGAVIVVLITVKWGTIPELPELIAFGLTVTSLVLAVLAIVYAYVSNASGVATTTRLTSAAESISRSADEVRAATAELTQHVVGLPDMISAVGASVNETKGLLSAAQSSQALSSPPSPSASTEAEPLGKQVVRRSSIAGLLLIVIAKRALEHKRSVSLDEIAKVAKLDLSEFWIGFAGGLSAAGLMDQEGSSSEWTVSRISPDLLSTLESRILQRADEQSKDLASVRKLTLNALAAIGSYFDAPSAPAEGPEAESGEAGA